MTNLAVSDDTARARRRIDLQIGIALFAVSLIVYLRTLCPTLYWDDCSELATDAYTLGVTHPTGYPLWILMGKAWTLLVPFGSIIWRLNTMSAFFGALAAPALYGFARASGLPHTIACTCAGLFAFSHTEWQQCLFTETYSLTACYTCALLFLVARWRLRGCRDADLRLLSCVVGLAMTNGQMNTLFVPGLIAYVFWADPTLRPMRAPAAKRWAAAAGMLVLPLAVYLYIPLRAHMQPAQNWGNPDSPFRFWYYITAREYSPLMFSSPHAVVRQNILRWGLGLGAEFPLPVVALALVGLAHLWALREKRPLALLLSWIIATNVFYSVNYAIYNQYIYFIASYAAIAALAGFGMIALWPLLERGVHEARRPVLQVAAMVGILVLVPLQMLNHWGQIDLSRNWTCYDYARNILATTAPGAILVDNSGDTSQGGVTYLQQVEGRRNDVVVVNPRMLIGLYDARYHSWVNRWYFEQFCRHYPAATQLYSDRPMEPIDSWDEDVTRRVISQAVRQSRPVYVLLANSSQTIVDDHGEAAPYADYLSRHYDLAQIGLLLRLYPQHTLPGNLALLAQMSRTWSAYRLGSAAGGMYIGDDFLTFIALDYARGDLVRARLAMKMGDDVQAATAYRQVLRLFRCTEATDGLARIAEAQTHPAGSRS